MRGQWSAIDVPSYDLAKKWELGSWNVSSRLRCSVVKDTFLVMAMRVPKAASSTMQTLVRTFSYLHYNLT